MDHHKQEENGNASENYNKTWKRETNIFQTL